MAMNTMHHHVKRPKADPSRTISQINSVDHDFLTPNETYGDINVFLSLLITGRIINSPFSSLYQRAKQRGWKDLFIDELRKLKIDDTFKNKRFMLNRLIKQCSETFDQEIQQIINEIENHMSDIIPTHWLDYTNPTIVHEIYNQVESWRNLQNQRRLFYKERSGLQSLLTLQQAITDHFLHLVNASHNDPEFWQKDGEQAFIDLFNHSLIIVDQPTGSERSVAITYEKDGERYLTKINTRIICLIDSNIVKKHLELSDISVKLYPDDPTIDLQGDIQSSLTWDTRTITSAENKEKSFYFSELTKTNPIRLKKMNMKDKPLYNQKICYLEFQTKIKLIGTDIEKDLTFKSGLFGLCSHTKCFPQYVAQVFITEVDKWYSYTDPQSHVKCFAEHINLYHKHVCGIEMNSFTRQVIETELGKNYKPSHETTNSIYKEILEKVITQINFMGATPFLSMMYYDRLFHGICNYDIDEEIKKSSKLNPLMLIRFDILQNQKIKEKPDIIFVICNGELRNVRITHNQLVKNMCRCFCEAVENRENSLQVFNYDQIIPFKNFSWYHDIDLNQNDTIKTDDGTNFCSLKLLLEDAMSNNGSQQSVPMANNLLPNLTTSDDQSRLFPETIDEQPLLTYTVHLSAEITGRSDLTTDLVDCLQEAFTQWRFRGNVQGSLSTTSFSQLPELTNNNEELNLFDDDLFLPDNNSYS